jgi:hypothetical protein
MKLNHALSAAVLAGTVLLTTTGCFHKEDASHIAPSAEIGVTATPTATATETTTPAPVPSETEAPVAEETTEADTAETEAEAPVEETKKEVKSNGSGQYPDVSTSVPEILNVVNGFYDYAEKEDSLDNLMEAGQLIQQQGALTDEQAKAIVASVPDAFKYFDTSTPENVKNAYNELTATAMGVKTAGTAVKFNVSVEAVNYKGDTATVDKNNVEVSINGEVQPTFPGDPNNLNLVKKDGKWLIVAVPNGR